MTSTNILWQQTIRSAPHTKKNSQVIAKHNGRTFVVQNKLYKKYEKECLNVIVPPEKPIDEPINLKCHFFMPTRRRVDLTNLLSAINDILVKAEVLEDDNSSIVYSMDGSRVFYDKDDPRTEITITRG